MSTQRPVLLLLACTVLFVSHANSMMPGMGMETVPKAVASDVPFIKCGVCEAIVKQAVRKVKSMRSELKPGHRLHEDAIIDYLETMCNPSKPIGSWITHYDIVEDGDKLKLVDTQTPSKCNTECATIARACSQLSDSLDLSDLSEALFAGKSRSALTQLACYEMSTACKAKPPPVPKDRPAGPAHSPMSQEETEQQEMMQRLKAAGLKGNMYHKDEFAQQLKDLQEQADDGDFPTDLLKEANTDSNKAADVKADSVADVVAEKVAQAGEAVQEVVAKASDVVQDVIGKASSLIKNLGSKTQAQEAEL